MRVLSSSVVCNPRQYAGEEAEEAEERDATARDGEARGSERYVGTEYEQRGCVRERSRKIEREREGGEGGEVPGINHNYNQRARKLHQSDPLWPPRLWWLRRRRMKIYRPTSVSFKVGRATLHTSLFHFFASFRKESLVESSRVESGRLVCVVCYTLHRVSAAEGRTTGAHSPQAAKKNKKRRANIS